MKRLNILFVCKYNRFRSRIAEAYFNKKNKNKKIKAKSVGAIKGSYLSKLSINTAKEFGLDIRGKTEGLNTKLLKWQNIIIIVADDVHPSLFRNNKKYGKKVINWKIRDVEYKKRKETERLIKDIMKRVDNLIKNLEEK